MRGEVAEHVVAFRVTTRELAFIIEIARRNNVSVGELLADAVNSYAEDIGEMPQLPRSLTVCRSLVTS